MNITPIARIHMIDAKQQAVEEQADQAARVGEFIAGLIVGGVCFGALVAIVVRLGGLPA